MSSFARGKYAKAISDRSGMEFPYNEMVKEWNGSLVHVSEFEAKQPKLELQVHGADAEALQNIRSDRTEPSVPVLLSIDSFETGGASSSTITVTEVNHGRSTSDTVRLNTTTFDGITQTILIKLQVILLLKLMMTHTLLVWTLTQQQQVM